jgi:UPF0716 protein FxsA
MFAKIFALFVTVALIELALFIVVGSRIGVGPTLLIILLTGMLGAGLTKSQGTRALRNFRQASAQGRLPHAEIVDGLMILVAGALLLSPGFFTDLVGFFILIPPVRAALRGMGVAYLMQRIIVPSGAADRPAAASRDPGLADGLAEGRGAIIDVEVVDN